MTLPEFSTVSVKLGTRSYDIRIGRGVSRLLAGEVKRISKDARCAIVTDTNVNREHGSALRTILDAQGIRHETIELAAGERSKSWPVLQNIVDQILDLRFERNDLLLAFGGGVVGDLAGFAASITRRGMRFIQLPTSLLAQVDSSVGGKTGINAAHGKNLVGAFYQPASVLIDLDMLKTLPAREFRAGYAEIIKYGLINQPDFFNYLDNNLDDIFSHGPSLSRAIAISCQSKADIVAADETEAGQRALLNLGHTFGHALEACTGYDSKRLIHGEGVAIGMMLAHRFSNRLNLCSQDDVSRVENHLHRAGLPANLQDMPGGLPSADTLMDFIAQDKKVRRGTLTFILTKGLGKSYIAEDVPPSEVSSFLKDQLNP